MSKRIPCNECREHKRRCSGDSPCERCQRLKLGCAYTIKRTPRDEEYIQEVEMIEQINTMRHTIAIMEAEIAKLQLKQPLIPQDSPFTASLTGTDSTDGSVYSSIRDGITHDNRSESGDPIEENRIIARNDQGYSVAVGPNEGGLDWDLTVEKGKLSIKTKIHNHSELLDCLHKMVTSVEFGKKIPMEFGCFTKSNPLSSVIRLLVWKRHGKSRFKGFVKEMVLMNKEEREPKAILPAVVETRQLTENLFWAYARCQHHFHLSIHIPTFYEICVAEGRSDRSPAVLSLCAHVALHPCRHMLGLIPEDQSRDYAAYFEERAREELCERFDEISLDVFAANVNLAIYYLHINMFDESHKYKAMATRLAHILEERYPVTDSGESALFYRILNAHNRLSMLSNAIGWELEKKHSNDEAKHSHNFGEVMARQREKHGFFIQTVAGDTNQEIAYINTYQSYNILYNEIFRILKSFQGTDLMNFVGVFGHQLEMAIRLWYNECLPAESRLSLPLFDDTIPEDVFFGTLMVDTARDALPIVTTLRVYAEYLIMVRSNLPDCYVKNHKLSVFSHSSGSEQDQSRVKHHIHKLLKLRDEINFDGSEEEYLENVLDALMIDTRDLKYSIIETGVKTARCCLRISRFLLNHPRDLCVFDARVCIDNYETLRRIAKLFAYDDREYSIMIRGLMKEYLDLMREALECEPLASRLSKKLPMMEKQLDEDFEFKSPNPLVDDFSDYINF